MNLVDYSLGGHFTALYAFNLAILADPWGMTERPAGRGGAQEELSSMHESSWKSQFQFGNFENPGEGVSIFQKCPNLNYFAIMLQLLPS